MEDNKKSTRKPVKLLLFDSNNAYWNELDTVNQDLIRIKANYWHECWQNKGKMTLSDIMDDLGFNPTWNDYIYVFDKDHEPNIVINENVDITGSVLISIDNFIDVRELL